MKSPLRKVYFHFITNWKVTKCPEIIPHKNCYKNMAFNFNPKTQLNLYIIVGPIKKGTSEVEEIEELRNSHYKSERKKSGR